MEGLQGLAPVRAEKPRILLGEVLDAVDRLVKVRKRRPGLGAGNAVRRSFASKPIGFLSRVYQILSVSTYKPLTNQLLSARLDGPCSLFKSSARASNVGRVGVFEPGPEPARLADEHVEESNQVHVTTLIGVACET